MGKLKILMIGPDRSVHGGISGVVNNFYEAGLAEKVDLTYIGTMVEGSKIRKLLKAMEAYVKFCMKLPGSQIVHVNMASDASYYRKSVFIRTAHLFHKKIVIHQHGGDFETFYYKELSERGKKRLRSTFAKADAFIVLTLYWQKFFSQIVEEEKIKIIPNATFYPEIDNKQYGKHELLFLGRICKEKGIRELFEVIIDLSKEYSDLRLYLGGIFEDENLKKMAEQYSDTIIFLGWLDETEKKKYLELCDIFVFPSYFEGQPVSVLEAMSYCLCIVASKVGGIPQMIEDGHSGLLVEPRDKDSLKTALNKVLGDKELCERMGYAASQKVKKEFSIDDSIEKLTALYGEVLGT